MGKCFLCDGGSAARGPFVCSRNFSLGVKTICFDICPSHPLQTAQHPLPITCSNAITSFNNNQSAMTHDDLLAMTLQKFAEPRRAAAARALDLIAELERTVGSIDAMHAELRRLGGHHVALRPEKTLELLAVRLRPIAGVSSNAQTTKRGGRLRRIVNATLRIVPT
jgi:hypothetical protein